jgi:hypothetical protein
VWLRRFTAAAAIVAVTPWAVHAAVGAVVRMSPPAVSVDLGEVEIDPANPDLHRFQRAYRRHRGRILEARLWGTPEEIGRQHGRLLHREMIDSEAVLYAELQKRVPLAPARLLLVDLSRFEFRNLDQQMPYARRTEIAAQAAAMRPDPFSEVLPTYPRFVFLQALYDVSLAFEHSPLLGCTSFALTGDAAFQGHAVLARNFDFEAGAVFDDQKAVFLVHEEGRIPYASVAWPGLVGGMTGMNAAGVAVVVHGGRATRPRAEGEPVLQTMRQLLGEARTTGEAVALLRSKGPMVSHIVMLLDREGDVAVVERAPGVAAYVRRGTHRVALTNHFEGPLSADPANRAVLAHTSSLARRARLDELLDRLPAGASAQAIVDVLRDRKGVGGRDLSLGSRCAIDALIATHSVVMDVSEGVLWVSEGPHLVGRYLRFDVARLLRTSFEPSTDDAIEAMPEDDLLTSGAYAAWAASGSPHTAEREAGAFCTGASTSRGQPGQGTTTRGPL